MEPENADGGADGEPEHVSPWESRLLALISQAAPDSRCSSRIMRNSFKHSPPQLVFTGGAFFALPLDVAKETELANLQAGTVVVPGIISFDASSVTIVGHVGDLESAAGHALAGLGLSEVKMTLRQLIVQRMGSSSAPLARPAGPSAFGALLVQLPVSGGHEGGEVDLCYSGSERKAFHFGGPESDAPVATLAAATFSSECDCTICPVSDGCRLLLVYDLARPDGHSGPLPTAASAGTAARAAAKSVAAIVREWKAAEAPPKRLAVPLKAPCPTDGAVSFAALRGADAAAAELLLACPALECQLLSYSKVVTKSRDKDKSSGKKVDKAFVIGTPVDRTHKEAHARPKELGVGDFPGFTEKRLFAAASFQGKQVLENSAARERSVKTWRVQALVFWPQQKPPKMVGLRGHSSAAKACLFACKINSALEALAASGPAPTDAALSRLASLAEAAAAAPEGCFDAQAWLPNSSEALGAFESAFAACARGAAAAGSAGPSDQVAAAASPAAAALRLKDASVLLLRAMASAVTTHSGFRAGATLASFLDAASSALAPADAEAVTDAAIGLLSANAAALHSHSLHCAQALWDPATRSRATRAVLRAALASVPGAGAADCAWSVRKSVEELAGAVSEFLLSEQGSTFQPEFRMNDKDWFFCKRLASVPSLLAACAGGSTGAAQDRTAALHSAAVAFFRASAAARLWGPNEEPIAVALAAAARLQEPLRMRATCAVVMAVAALEVTEVKLNAISAHLVSTCSVGGGGGGGDGASSSSPLLSSEASEAFSAAAQALLRTRQKMKHVKSHLSAVAPAAALLQPADAARVNSAAADAIAWAAPSLSKKAFCFGALPLLWSVEARVAAARRTMEVAAADLRPWWPAGVAAPAGGVKKAAAGKKQMMKAKRRLDVMAKALFSAGSRKAYKFEPKLSEAFARAAAAHPSADELHAHLVQSPAVVNAARTGDPGACAILRARVAALQPLIAAAAPGFSWEQPEAVFPSRADVQAFLKGPKQAEIFHDFAGIGKAREFVLYVENWSNLAGACSVTAVAQGMGKNASVTITKTQAWFDSREAAFAKQKEEHRRLSSILQPQPQPQHQQQQPAAPVAVAAATAAAAAAAVGVRAEGSGSGKGSRGDGGGGNSAVAREEAAGSADDPAALLRGWDLPTATSSLLLRRNLPAGDDAAAAAAARMPTEDAAAAAAVAAAAGWGTQPPGESKKRKKAAVAESAVGGVAAQQDQGAKKQRGLAVIVVG